MSRMSKRLRAFSARELSQGLGVSLRQAERYRAAGKLPQTRVLAFDEWSKHHRAPTRAAEKKLLQMAPEDLGAYAGVTARTARRWIAKGRVPERARHELLTVFQPAPEPRELRVPMGRRYAGRRTEGRQFTVSVNAELTKGSLLKISSWVSRLPYKGGKRMKIQLVANAKTTLAFDEALPGKAYLQSLEAKANEEGERAADYTIASYAYGSKSSALKNFVSELRDVLDFDVYVTEITAFVREF